jgi:tetratricopeptide (TPR) repeat protein
MTKNIGPGCFEEQSIELLPAFFVLATANICIGGARLKKAENFLVSAFWNLLKSTSDESEKRSDDDLVSAQDIERFKAGLHKTFGRFFLAQNAPDSYTQALEHLTKGIYLECVEFGPESYFMGSSYYYMGELFKKEGEIQKAKAFFSKIIQIWHKFILENDFDQMQEYTFSPIEPIHYEEADQHLRNMLIFFEMEFG